MYLSNPAKSFLLAIPFFVSTIGCGFVGSGSNNAPRVIEAPASSIPFKTKEPENFQCEILESAGKTTRRKRIAKKGSWRRVDFEPGEATHRAVLQTEKEYLIDVGRRIYAEMARQAGEQQFSELTRELITAGSPSVYEETAREGSLVTYAVRPDGSNGSEMVLHYDESIGMPVKQEFYSLNDGVRTLSFSVELLNFSTEPELGLFELPAGFRKVSMNEFQTASAGRQE